MSKDLWNPDRCNFEAPGTGLINAADWYGAARPPSFPSEGDLRTRFSAELKAHPKIELLISHKGGMGDTVMCSTVAHELRRRGVRNIWLETRWARDFQGQPGFDGVLPESYETEWLTEKLGGRIVYPAYARALPQEDREIPPAGHILGEMCRRSGLSGEITLRPYFAVSGEAAPELPRDFIAIGGLGDHAVPTKNWFADRFQALAALLGKEFQLVQLGAKAQPLLAGAVDLRGRTDLRQAAGVLQKARCFVGEVGGLMHLARAVDCPSVVIYGGREAPRQSGYAANINLVGQVPCAPCWIIKKCPHDMACMELIHPAGVFAAVKELLGRSPSRPLAAEKIDL